VTGGSITISRNTLQRNLGGIQSYGSGLTAKDNTISDNSAGGIYLADSETGVSITGNTIQNNPIGILFENQVGVGSGNIYNNYFANAQNVYADTGSNPGNYGWNNPSGPTSGTNVVGGPNIAGNYWSNPSGTGWSDRHTRDSRGYTDEQYTEQTGVYDNNPLVNTPAPTPAPTRAPDNDTSDGQSSQSESGTSDQQIRFVITAASLGDQAGPGIATTLSLILENRGSTSLPPQTRIVLVPANDAAQELGELETRYEDGQYMVTSSLDLPSEPGTYVYIFTPKQIIKDPLTGEDIRIPAGGPVQFTVVVEEDGTVSVTMG